MPQIGIPYELFESPSDNLEEFHILLQCISTLLKDPIAQQLFGNGTLAEAGWGFGKATLSVESGGASIPVGVIAVPAGSTQLFM